MWYTIESERQTTPTGVRTMNATLQKMQRQLNELDAQLARTQRELQNLKEEIAEEQSFEEIFKLNGDENELPEISDQELQEIFA